MNRMRWLLPGMGVVALLASCSPRATSPESSVSGPGAVVTIAGEADFAERVLSSRALVLVDFYADWCGPCRRLAPILEEVAREQQPAGMVVAKVNVDEHRGLARQYGVRGIPHLALVRDGQVVGKRVGYTGKAELTTWIEAQR
ncbi:MAG: Thioredoxin-1 [Lentisphaerae bacterium ADurb.BinA184]|mgnify:CR=1 FL=1|nr:MAG: Thioredoxin-1 [Lentisphaerae bacterium ADurb.BinA184]